MANNKKKNHIDKPLELKSVVIGDPEKALQEITTNLRTQRTQLFQRIERVMLGILEGATRNQILTHIQKKWDIGRRQADKYLALGEKEIIKHAEKHKKKRMPFHIKARLNLYRKMMIQEDYRGAGAVLSDLAQIEGLKNYNPIEDADNYKERKQRAIKLLEQLNPQLLKPITGKSKFEID